MLKRLNGIKPTHLWHLTPRKHFLAAINDRKNYEQRDKKGILQISAIVFGLVLAGLYSYGQFSPEKTLMTIIKNPCEPNVPTSNRSNSTGALSPCPKDWIKLLENVMDKIEQLKFFLMVLSMATLVEYSFGLITIPNVKQEHRTKVFNNSSKESNADISE